jgi:hypothetical protein
LKSFLGQSPLLSLSMGSLGHYSSFQISLSFFFFFLSSFFGVLPVSHSMPCRHFSIGNGRGGIVSVVWPPSDFPSWLLVWPLIGFFAALPPCVFGSHD